MSPPILQVSQGSGFVLSWDRGGRREGREHSSCGGPRSEGGLGGSVWGFLRAPRQACSCAEVLTARGLCQKTWLEVPAVTLGKLVPLCALVSLLVEWR